MTARGNIGRRRGPSLHDETPRRSICSASPSRLGRDSQASAPASASASLHHQIPKLSLGSAYDRLSLSVGASPRGQLATPRTPRGARHTEPSQAWATGGLSGAADRTDASSNRSIGSGSLAGFGGAGSGSDSVPRRPNPLLAGRANSNNNSSSNNNQSSSWAHQQSSNNNHNNSSVATNTKMPPKPARNQRVSSASRLRSPPTHTPTISPVEKSKQQTSHQQQTPPVPAQQHQQRHQTPTEPIEIVGSLGELLPQPASTPSTLPTQRGAAIGTGYYQPRSSLSGEDQDLFIGRRSSINSMGYDRAATRLSISGAFHEFGPSSTPGGGYYGYTGYGGPPYGQEDFCMSAGARIQALCERGMALVHQMNRSTTASVAPSLHQQQLQVPDNSAFDEGQWRYASLPRGSMRSSLVPSEGGRSGALSRDVATMGAHLAEMGSRLSETNETVMALVRHLSGGSLPAPPAVDLGGGCRGSSWMPETMETARRSWRSTYPGNAPGLSHFGANSSNNNSNNNMHFGLGARKSVGQLPDDSFGTDLSKSGHQHSAAGGGLIHSRRPSASPHGELYHAPSLLSTAASAPSEGAERHAGKGNPELLEGLATQAPATFGRSPGKCPYSSHPMAVGGG